MCKYKVEVSRNLVYATINTSLKNEESDINAKPDEILGQKAKTGLSWANWIYDVMSTYDILNNNIKNTKWSLSTCKNYTLVLNGMTWKDSRIFSFLKSCRTKYTA